MLANVELALLRLDQMLVPTLSLRPPHSEAEAEQERALADLEKNAKSVAAKKARERQALEQQLGGADASETDLQRERFNTQKQTDSIHRLNGENREAKDRVRDLKARTGKKVMKVIKVSEPKDLVRAEAYVRIADALMFDAKPPKGMKDALPGGNAVSFDWRILSGRKWPLPWMLAGGLTKDNVATAVELSGARIADTSSGVEDVPGHKNVDKIAEFLRAVAEIR